MPYSSEKQSRIRIALRSLNPLDTVCNSTVVREATSNIYGQQFEVVMKEQMSRLKFRFGEIDWKLESGESVNGKEITMFVNLWADDNVILPMMMTFSNTEDVDVLVQYWRAMFNEFIRITNEGRVFSKLTQGLVELRAKRKKESETSSDIQKVEERGSKRLR